MARQARMDKKSHGSTRADAGNDYPEGLFIGPLDDADSLRKIDAQEAKLLQPPERKAPARDPSASGKSPLLQNEELLRLSRNAARSAPLADSHLNGQEAAMLRFASELKSIKQDLISIREHFEALRRPHLEQMPSPPSEQAPTSQSLAAETALLDDIRKLLQYLDRLLESLPEEKIEEFANSEYFELYRTVFEKLGLS